MSALEAEIVEKGSSPLASAAAAASSGNQSEEEKNNEESLSKSYILLLVDTLRRLSDYDRFIGFSDSSEYQKQQNNQSMLRISARLNTLRHLANSHRQDLIFSDRDYAEILERYFYLPSSSQNLKVEQNNLVDFILNNCLNAQLSNKATIQSAASANSMLPSKLQEIPIEDIEKYTDSKNLKSSQVLDSEDNTTNVSAMEKSSIDPCAADKTPKEVISAENRKFRLTFNCSSFLGIVLAYRCYDSKQYELGANLCELIMKCVANGGHIFSLIAEKAFFMFALMHEKLGSLTAQRFLLQQYLSFSMKRKQYAHQSILINAILRSYISESSFDLANKFAVKVDFPYDVHSDQWARYQFYMGKINALSGSYSDSLKHFTEASRKCPTGYAFDFHSIVTKNLLIVTLLLGNMPEKSLLSGKHMEAYRRLAASVVQGKLQEFHKVVASNRHLYEKDQMLGLILRLPNNVLKMALKLICKSYSHISLEDVAKRLELSDLSDVHYILQNAIMNNVIQATIENQSVLVSKPQPDLYCSAKPSKLFQDRTEFCQKLLEKSKKAIRHIQDLKAYDEEDYIDLSDTQFDFDLFNNNYSDMTDEF